MDVADRVACFAEQIMCGVDVYTWKYDENISLVKSNCPHEAILGMLQEAFGAKDALIRYLSQDALPLVISAPVGLMWCAVRTREGEKAVYVIGPVRTTQASRQQGTIISMEEASRSRGVSMELLREISARMDALPVVMPNLVYQYALMLHWCVNTQRLTRSDIKYAETRTLTQRHMPKPDRQLTWQFEQKLLDMVRNGDLAYRQAFNNASNVSNGVPVKSSENMRQEKTSVIIFTSLCTRAAIEGGMTPENAYALGDMYIQQVEDAHTPTEIGALSTAMYAAFVEEVRAIRLGKALSPHVRAVCDYVELHAEEKLNVNLLARQVAYSPEHLSRKFHGEMGVSLPDYIRSIRIQRAKTMLAADDLPIQDIAQRLQFSSRGHFSEVFLKEVGQTPARYRADHRHNQVIDEGDS